METAPKRRPPDRRGDASSGPSGPSGDGAPSRVRLLLGPVLLPILVPAGLLVVRVLHHQRSISWGALSAELLGEALTYAYVTLTALGLGAAGAWALHRAGVRLRGQAMTDPLTGLYDRRFFGAELGSAMARDRRERRVTCVLCVDLDRLKSINDTFGHDRGDEALALVAGALSRRLRGRDVVARFGGDEFAVLLPDTGVEAATAIGRRVLEELAASSPSFPDGLSVSIGVAELGDGVSAHDLMIAADRALYVAKHAGGGRVMAAVLAQPASVRGHEGAAPRGEGEAG